MHISGLAYIYVNTPHLYLKKNSYTIDLWGVPLIFTHQMEWSKPRHCSLDMELSVIGYKEGHLQYIFLSS